MEIGLLPGVLHEAMELGRLAAKIEAAGFDSLWLGDHVSFPVPILDPLLVLACYAAHTTRIRLGTCVYLLPLRHPTPVAKMVATLDFLSGGRVIFGVGVGGEFPREFEACGVPVNERGGRTNEAIEILRRAWSGSSEAFRGRFFDVPLAPIMPGPVQRGGPPIWIGGRSEAALRRTARLGDGYVAYLVDPDGFRERMERIHELAAVAGGDVKPLTGALLAFAFVDDDRASATARASRTLGTMYGRSMERAAERYCLLGGIEECRDKLARYEEAGVEHIVLSPFAAGKELDVQIERMERLLEP